MDDMNEQAYLIPNGFDFKFFHYSTPIEQRDPFHIAYMYHTNPIKGTEVAFQAFELVKKAIPELRVTMFSAYSKPNRLPNWCDFYQQPDQSLFNTIYNEAAIYVGSIVLAIIMGQSSYTYSETSTGYKGWIESGNSLSAILIMSLFIMLQRVREKKITILVIVAVAAYLITTIGTRTGLLGTFIAVGLYLLLEMFFSRNKKIIIAGLSLMTIAILVVVFAGSKTIQRRQQMNQSQYTIIDEATGEVGNMTGDMLRIKNKILNNTLEEGYMSEAQKQSVLDLHEYTKSVKLAGNDTRTQQLMYNIYLMKNQHSFTGIVFGNGYNNNEREMRMENELASLFLNFGLCGFILYACPILAVLIYAIVFGIKKRKDITLSYVMNVAALILAIGLSWLSGYVLFATSSMTVIVVIATLLLVEIKKIKKSKDSKIADAE
jgi:predicted membrane protein